MAMDGDFSRLTSFVGKDSIDKEKVNSTISDYNSLYVEDKGGNVDTRKKKVHDFSK